MSMESNPSTPLTAAQQTLYLLGELSGKMSSVQTSVANQASAAAASDAQNKREHDEFRSDIATIKATQPVKVSPWVKVGIVVAIPSSVVSLIGFISLYFQPN